MNTLTHRAIAQGEIWYIKRPGATAITEVEITDITEKTLH
jgi:hypothetical protein